MPDAASAFADLNDHMTVRIKTRFVAEASGGAHLHTVNCK